MSVLVDTASDAEMTAAATRLRLQLLARTPLRHRRQVIRLTDAILSPDRRDRVRASVQVTELSLLAKALEGDRRARKTLALVTDDRQRWRDLGATAPDDLELYRAIVATVDALEAGDTRDPIEVLVAELLAGLHTFLADVASPLPPDPCPSVPAHVGTSIVAHAPPASSSGRVERVQEVPTAPT